MHDFFAREPIYYIRSPQPEKSTLCEEQISTTERMIDRLGGMLAAGFRAQGFRVWGEGAKWVAIEVRRLSAALKETPDFYGIECHQKILY